MFQAYEKKMSSGVCIGNGFELEPVGNDRMELGLTVEGSEQKWKLKQVLHLQNL